MHDPLQGVLPILQTPFTAADEIDFDALRKEIDWAFTVGADGVCTGMVSETLRLTEDERIALTTQMAAFTAGRGHVVASIGAESTKGAIRFGQSALHSGCTAVMAIPPINARLPEEALWDYFVAIAENVDLPLIVQDASSYVGQAIPIGFTYGSWIASLPRRSSLNPKLRRSARISQP